MWSSQENKPCAHRRQHWTSRVFSVTDTLYCSLYGKFRIGDDCKTCSNYKPKAKRKMKIKNPFRLRTKIEATRCSDVDVSYTEYRVLYRKWYSDNWHYVTDYWSRVKVFHNREGAEKVARNITMYLKKIQR